MLKDYYALNLNSKLPAFETLLENYNTRITINDAQQVIKFKIKITAYTPHSPLQPRPSTPSRNLNAHRCNS
jgi:hypothetical protein